MLFFVFTYNNAYSYKFSTVHKPVFTSLSNKGYQNMCICTFNHGYQTVVTKPAKQPTFEPIHGGLKLAETNLGFQNWSGGPLLVADHFYSTIQVFKS